MIMGQEISFSFKQAGRFSAFGESRQAGGCEPGWTVPATVEHATLQHAAWSGEIRSGRRREEGRVDRSIRHQLTGGRFLPGVCGSDVSCRYRF